MGFFDNPVESVKNAVNSAIHAGTQAINHTVDIGKGAINSAVHAGTNTINHTIDIGKSAINSAVHTGTNTLNHTIDIGKSAVNSSVDIGKNTINSTVNKAIDEIKNSASKAVDVALNKVTEIAFLLIKPVIKNLIDAGSELGSMSHYVGSSKLASQNTNYSFGFTIGPFTMEIDKLQDKRDTLMRLVENPPKNREEYKQYFRELEPTSFKVEGSLQASALIVTSKMVSIGCELTITPDYQNLDELDPIFEALNIT